MMDHEARTGISEVLIERFDKERLPRMLKIKQHVDQGLILDEAELGFLHRVLNDAQDARVLVESIPECRDLFARVIHLYHDITAKALENEDQR
jgi:hypothetical protein